MLYIFSLFAGKSRKLRLASISPNCLFPYLTSCFVLQFSIEKEKCVVFVVSTTGDGEPPDTVAKFWRRLRKKTLDSTFLKGLHFALLGRYFITYPGLFVSANAVTVFDLSFSKNAHQTTN